MTKIVKKPLPNGKIPFTALSAQVSKVIMQLNENIVELHEQVKTLQNAVVELQQ